MSDRNWKRVERVVAKKLGGRRIPLSGRNNLGAVGDVQLVGYKVEVKSGLQVPRTVSGWLATLIELTQVDDAKNISILVMQPKWSKGQVAVLTLTDLARLVNVQERPQYD
jgi:hypothetical protein